MLYQKLLSRGSIAAIIPIVAAGNSFCKGGIPALVASALVGQCEPAETYCSSVYPLPKITSTKTANTKTVTTTVATEEPTTTVATITNTITPTTETITVTAATQTDSTTIAVDTTIVTIFSEATTTSTSTVFAFSIIQKRDVEDKLVGRTNPKALAQWHSVQKQAKSFVGSVCTCLQTPVTNYATTTPSTTVSVTATSPLSVTATATATVTDTSTISATATTTATFSVTETSSTTITTTTTVIATTTQVLEYRGPICNNPNSKIGVGGCASNCYCDPRVPGGQEYGVCDTDVNCNAPTCASDADCGPGRACANYGCGQPQCVNFSGCSSTFVPPQLQQTGKRGLAGSEKRTDVLERREKAVELETLLVCRRKGIQPELCEA